jgi:hypothetical protein
VIRINFAQLVTAEKIARHYKELGHNGQPVTIAQTAAGVLALSAGTTFCAYILPTGEATHPPECFPEAGDMSRADGLGG